MKKKRVQLTPEEEKELDQLVKNQTSLDDIAKELSEVKKDVLGKRVREIQATGFALQLGGKRKKQEEGKEKSLENETVKGNPESERTTPVKARILNQKIESVQSKSETVLHPFVFEAEGHLYILWWQNQRVDLSLKKMDTVTLTVRATINPPEVVDLKEILSDVPKLELQPQVAEFEVNFEDTPVFYDQSKLIRTDKFYGVKVKRNTSGNEFVQFE